MRLRPLIDVFEEFLVEDHEGMKELLRDELRDELNHLDQKIEGHAECIEGEAEDLYIVRISLGGIEDLVYDLNGEVDARVEEVVDALRKNHDKLRKIEKRLEEVAKEMTR